MIKILVKVIKTLSIGVVAFVLIYLSVTFFMRNEHAVWCMATFGNFEESEFCKYDNKNTEECRPPEKLICNNGIFDLHLIRRIKKKIKCPDLIPVDRSLSLRSKDGGIFDKGERSYFIKNDKKIFVSEIEPEQLKWINKNCKDRMEISM